MSTPAANPERPRARRVRVGEGKLWIELVDGREVGCPLSFFPRLASAKPADLKKWELIGRGSGIHWPRLDEDLSVEGILRGERAVEPDAAKLAPVAAFLRAARKASGLTQAELAERLDRSQTLVSLAERARVWTGEPYRQEVLRACGLSRDWKPRRA